MEEENIIKVGYNDLDDNLKDQVRDNYREDEFLVPEDWYYWIVEDINEKYKSKGIEIDDESLEFDLYRGSLTYKGEIDLDNPEIKKKLSDSYHEWTEKEWLYDFPTTFTDESLDEEYYIQADVIADEIEEEIFGGAEFEVSDGKVSMGFEAKPYLEKAVKKYENDCPDEAETMKGWLNLYSAADLFFQDEIVIDEDEYDSLVANLATEIEKLIELEVMNMISDISSDLSDLYSEFKNNLQSSYDEYYTDEHADANLEDRTFEVEVDEDGNQLEVIDLNGEW